jgi:hypothetical protein
MIAKKARDPLAGFIEHGVVITKNELTQAAGVCPFCETEHFYINPVNLLWDCKRCGISGNFSQFLKRRMKVYQEHFVGELVVQLFEDRGITPQTFRAWGVGYNVLTRSYMIPMDGNNVRSVSNIHIYKIGGKPRSTSGGRLDLLCPVRMLDTKVVWIVEGDWDAMALYEMLNGEQLVVGIPGANNFPRSRIGLFRGVEVRIVCDNDPAGERGAERTGHLLEGIASKVKYMHWPSDLNLPQGFGPRKLYIQDKNNALAFITANLKNQTPTKEAKELPEGFKPSGKGLLPDEVLASYRKWLHIPNSEPLDVLYGSAFANRLNTDPVWMFIVAPPGGMKTELVMSISEAEGVENISSLTPKTLISGNTAGGDSSLIPQLNEKLLLIKDFTPILMMNPIARDEILGTLRDAYDGECSKGFGSRLGSRTIRKYKSKFGIIAAVTPAIEGLAAYNSILGERFLKYRIKHAGRINVGREVILRSIANLTQETEMRAELKRVGAEVLSRHVTPEEFPKVGTDIAEKLLTLAQLVSALRGCVSRERYTGFIAYKPVIEIGTRLAKQFCALAMGIAIYRWQTVITDDVMRIVYRVGLDTIPDKVEELVKQLYIHEEVGDVDVSGHIKTDLLSQWSRLPTSTVSLLLQDLDLLFIVRKKPGTRPGFWKLNPTVTRLLDSLGLYSLEVTHAREVRRKTG